MKIVYLSLIPIFSFIITPAAAQNKGTAGKKKNVTTQLKLLSPESIGGVNFDQEQLLKEANQITDALESVSARYTSPQDIMLVETWHKTTEPTFTVYGRPKLDAANEASILAAAKAKAHTRATFVDYSIAYIAKANGGFRDSTAAYIPQYQDPTVRLDDELRSANLETKYRIIQKWAASEALPLVLNFERYIDKRYAGSKAFLQSVQGTDFSKPTDVLALTDRNEAYWKASMEIARGNQIVPITKILMLASQGQLDYARKYADVITAFSDPSMAPTYVLKRLVEQIDILNEDVNRQLTAGKALNNAGKYADAQKAYADILAAYPTNAGAAYEQYYSINTQNIAEKKIKADDRTGWESAKKNIYTFNPLYSGGASAGTAEEAYLLSRRGEISGLLKSPVNMKKDLLRLADISLDLGDYGFAAQMYWLLQTSLPGDYGDRNLAASFLYCLDKLGVKGPQAVIKLDFPKEFSKIEARREKDMKESAGYKAFRK